MDPIGAEDGFPDMWIQFGESSRLDYAFNHLGKHSKKIWYFFRNISLTGGPPTLSKFRNKNVTFGQKSRVLMANEGGVRKIKMEI